MKSIDLPVIDAKTSINDAWDLLQERKRSSLLVRSDDSLCIIRDADLVIGSVKGFEQVAEISGKGIEPYRRVTVRAGMGGRPQAIHITRLSDDKASLSGGTRLMITFRAGPAKCACTDPGHRKSWPPDHRRKTCTCGAQIVCRG